ncbi:MAG: tetratricopeptide repeat protein [Xanthobacteraceae bacterium]
MVEKADIPSRLALENEIASEPAGLPELTRRQSELIAALFSDASKLHQDGRIREAEYVYKQILAARPDHFDCMHALGVALHQLGDHAQAVRLIGLALKQNPRDAIALNNLGSALAVQGRLAEALVSFSSAVAARPDYAEAYVHCSGVLRELGRDAEAIEGYDRALALRPDLAEAHCGRGTALANLRRLDEAIQSYDRALKLSPDFAEAHCGRGIALAELDRIDEALDGFAQAQSLRPDYAEAHVNEATYRLLLGDFERGFEKYEWRWQTARFKTNKRSFAQALWRGSDDIAGKTVLLYGEQGFGDTIQFARYVPLVAALGARIVLEVPGPLHALMVSLLPNLPPSLPGQPQIVAAGDPLPDFDLQCPLLSLPLALRTRLDTIPCDSPYLSAPAEKAAAWRDRLGAHARPRIGLVWAGNPRKDQPHIHRLDHERSLALDQLAPLFEVDACSFYSLQKGDDAQRQLREGPWRDRVIDFTDDLHDFSDTAALIENLDLVISVDTSVLHLAGALGKSVWLMNRYNTCWRWLRDRDDSPWYPSLRQFRQDAARDWGPVVRRIAAALRDYVRGFNEGAARRGLLSHAPD